MSLKESHIACYHCGDSCKEELLTIQEKSFCCEGCKTVFQLLDENDLCNYYNPNQFEGNRKPVSPRKFDFLEEESIASSFLQYQDDRQAKVEFFIPDMHCASCIWLLEKLYKLLPGILHARVNFDQKRLFVSYNPQELNLRTLVEKLSAIGYEPSLEKESQSNKRTGQNRSLLLRIGVAGFCMGNIMLFSFPEYLGMDPASQLEFGVLFRWLSYGLALPVVGYSANVIWKNAWKGLKSKQVNIDVPLAIGILTLFIRSLVEVVVYGQPGYFDSLSALVFFLLIGRWMQERAYESMSFERDYQSYFPVAVRKLGEGAGFVSLKDLKVGDQIRVLANELIPADARIESGTGEIDYSFVTGESEPERIIRGNRVYAGGRQMAGPLELTILKPVQQSYLTSLWNQQDMKQPFSVIQKFSDTIAKWFTIALVTLASLTLLYWYPIDQDIAFRAFTAVLIVACPCVLVIAAPFAFGNAMRWLSRKGIYLKNPGLVEQVAQIKQLAFDKTGTLSTGEKHVKFEHFTCTQEEEQLIASLASANNHPLSKALLSSLRHYSDLPAPQEIKFAEGKGLEAWIAERHIKIGSAQYVGANSSGETETFAAIEGEIKVHLTLTPVYRSDLDEVLMLRLKAYPKRLITGDNDRERSQLNHWFNANEMHFNCSPQEKLELLKTHQQYGPMMMLGDGLNDAGALKVADVGVAITDDINTFTPASDVIMVGKSIALLPKFLSFCQDTLKTVKFSFLFSLGYNLIWMAIAVQGLLDPLVASLLMPISSITVFGINTLGIRYFARKAGIQ